MKYKHKVWDLVVEIDPSDQYITEVYWEPINNELWKYVRIWWEDKFDGSEPLTDYDFSYFIGANNEADR